MKIALIAILLISAGLAAALYLYHRKNKKTLPAIPTAPPAPVHGDPYTPPKTPEL